MVTKISDKTANVDAVPSAEWNWLVDLFDGTGVTTTNVKWAASSGLALDIQSNALVVNSTNSRVGMGTATPSEVLDVVGNIAVSGTVDGVDVGALETASSAHIAASSGVHGASGDVVGTTDTQTLSAKTLTSPVINVTSDAQGDMYYRDGSGNFVRLAPGTSGKVLQTNGGGANPSWETVAGTGDVVGPASATDHGIARYDLTTGKLIQDSGVTIDDSDNIDIPGALVVDQDSGLGTLGGGFFVLEVDTSAGQVGINTHPTEALDVGGNARVTGNVIVDTIAEKTNDTGVTVDSCLIKNGSAADSLLLGSQNGAYYLARANHTGTQAASTITALIAASDETTDLTTGTAKATFRIPKAITLTEVRASVTTAPTGSTIIVDINESGSTILSTKLTIDATEKTSTTAATPPVISDSSLADDAEITIDIDQIGSTIAGAGLKIWLIGTRT